MGGPLNVLEKPRGLENRLDPQLSPEPATVSGKQGEAPVLGMMVSAIRNLKGTLQTQRMQGSGRRSLVVGFTAQGQAWGGEGVWETWMSLRMSGFSSQSLSTCWRGGGRVVRPGLERFTSPQPRISTGGSTSLRTGAVQGSGVEGGAGRVSRELLRLPPL